MYERDDRIDFLRFLGLSMIVLAHVSPPQWLFQLRNFDVPLMVLVSGASFALSWKPESYFDYIYKRVRRLVLPVWIFFVAYFFVRYIFGLPSPAPSIGVIAGGLLLFSGIDYVWIIRVFLLVALFSPLVYKLSNSIKSNKVFFACLIFFYFFYEVLAYISFVYFSGMAGKFFDRIVLYALAYLVVFAVGLRLSRLRLAHVFVSGVALLLLAYLFFLFLFLFYGEVVFTQKYKYPPGVYYLLYSLGFSFVVFSISRQIVSLLEGGYFEVLYKFVSKNSIWIYLWHVLFVDIFGPMGLWWLWKYLLVFSLAVAFFSLQWLIVVRLISPSLASDFRKKSVVSIFTG